MHFLAGVRRSGSGATDLRTSELLSPLDRRRAVQELLSPFHTAFYAIFEAQTRTLRRRGIDFQSPLSRLGMFRNERIGADRGPAGFGSIAVQCDRTEDRRRTDVQ
ncbi:hypothetical protein BQ8794_240088 [Mesorhizobium prunaredense]|uniref:Uncharacterized protein n=3 Tax=Mesorhizobium TaxID=68287 RepID=A0A1R3V7T1_9HYPH|nr:conserved hypothetical protein [Mesorhizobium escarrei]SIT55881.1 hypothetical protein BQ8794_240088 [Mesorhizobium prunaredense]SJM34669.1 hypothetical protein BQ8482_490008 [Mesorhizobium delmotii]